MMYRKIKPEQLLSQGNCAIFVEKGQLTILDIVNGLNPGVISLSKVRSSG